MTKIKPKVKPVFDEDERCVTCYRPLQREKTTVTTRRVVEMFDPTSKDWIEAEDDSDYHSDETTEESVCSKCEYAPERCKCEPLDGI